MLYTFGLIGTILVVLPIVEVIAVIISSTIVLEKGSLLLLDLLSRQALFCPVFLAVFLILSLAAAELGFTEALEHLADNGLPLIFVHGLLEAALLESVGWGLFLFFKNFTH